MKNFLFLFSAFCAIALIFTPFVFGQPPGSCYNRVCEPYDYYADCWEYDCQPNNSCYFENCPQPQPGNICCRPGVACPESKPTWTWAHNATCVVRTADEFGAACFWQWQYEYCSAGDRCPPCNNGGGAEAICAGQCADSGCVTGGWYKTCCQVAGAITAGARLTGVAGTCTGSGGCSGTNVTTVRWSGFASPGPACSNALCLQSWDGWSWIVGTCGATPEPTVPGGGGGLEPTTAPGGSGKCGEDYYQGDCGCSAWGCEKIKWGVWPNGNCSPCYSKRWDQNCKERGPKKPRLINPLNSQQVTTNVSFVWYRYRTPVDSCYAGGDHNPDSSCWGYNCYNWQYWPTTDNRVYELFVTQGPNVPNPGAKRPEDWGEPVLRVWGEPDTLIVGEKGTASDRVTRQVGFTSRTPGTYYWFIRARNGWHFGQGLDGVTDSDMGSFNYCAVIPPGQPTCTYPSGGQLINDTTITFRWDAPSTWGAGCPDNKSYQVLLDESGGPYPPTTGACVILGGVNNPVTQCTYPDLKFGKTYNWMVKATNNTIFTYGTICSFTVKEPDPWWQTTDGDVHAQGTIISSIPKCATDKYLSLAPTGGEPGVVSWGGASIPNLQPEGSISSLEWQANDLYRRPQVGFDYLANRLKLDKSKVFSGDLGSTPDGIYYVNAPNAAFDFTGGSVGDKKVVVFVEGDVKVTADTTVSTSGFFALITKGRITFDSSVTRVEGFFLADGVIDTSVASTAFKGYGSFVAWGGFAFQRDLGEGTFNCAPSETFFSRPDLYINAPKEFLITPSFFQEMAP